MRKIDDPVEYYYKELKMWKEIGRPDEKARYNALYRTKELAWVQWNRLYSQGSVDFARSMFRK